MIEILWRDIRHGFLKLRKDLSLTVIGTGLIALGAGLNALVFCFVNAVVLRPLPYQDPDRLCVVQKNDPKHGNYIGVSLSEFDFWREHSGGFEELAAVTAAGVHLGGTEQPGPVAELIVTSNYFRLLKVHANLGRTFAPGEDKTDSDHVVVISNGLWRRAFGSDPAIIGHAVQLDGLSHTIIGVIPPRFHDPNFYRGADLWVPLAVDTPPSQQGPGLKNLIILGRIGRNVDKEQARSQLEATARTWQSENSKAPTEISLRLTGLEEVIPHDASSILLLFITAWLILLISCANLANMLLVRLNSRRKEFAIRQALGASRLRVTFQVLAETWLLTLSGSAVAVLLVRWGLPLLIAMSPENTPRIEEASFDLRALVYTLVISMMMGAVGALISTIHLPWSKANGGLPASLKEAEGATSPIFRGNRAGRALVVFEVALTVTLSVGAGLMIRTFFALRPINMGFDPESKLVVRLTMPKAKYGTPTDQVNLSRNLLNGLQLIPAVESAAADVAPPLSGFGGTGHVRILGESNQRETQARIYVRQVSENYFQLMRVELFAGRAFAKTDDGKALPVVIVNKTLAETLWAGENPCGKQIMVPEIDPVRELRVIGVVGDERLFATVTDRLPQAYFSYAQYPGRYLHIIVHTRINPTKVMDAVRKQLVSVDGDIDFYPAETMEQMFAGSVSRPRYYATLMGTLAALALLVASMGIYGVMSYGAAQSTHEIGIRTALGAERMDIIRLVLGEGMLLTMYGIGFGLMAALLSAHLIASLLYGVRPTDPLTFIMVSLVLAGAALMATYLPARRAAAIDPAVAMRYE